MLQDGDSPSFSSCLQKFSKGIRSKHQHHGTCFPIFNSAFTREKKEKIVIVMRCLIDGAC